MHTCSSECTTLTCIGSFCIESVATRNNEPAPPHPTPQAGVAAAVHASISAIPILLLRLATPHPALEEHMTHITARHMFNNTSENFVAPFQQKISSLFFRGPVMPTIDGHPARRRDPDSPVDRHKPKLSGLRF
jgi:hypothetical protein